jgi:hypothetical protein
MDFKETTEEFVKNMEENSVSSSLQNEAARSAHTSTSTTATTTTAT